MLQHMKKIINIPINQDILKLIAILTMTIDHLGYIFTPSYEMPLRFIGRISFPIFAFLLAYNLTQKDLFKKYITRLTSFAVSTSLILIPFKYQIGNVLPLNIFWTLLLGVITIYTIEITNKKFKQNNAKYIIIGYILCFSALLSSITDYEFFGFLYILSLYSWYKYCFWYFNPNYFICNEFTSFRLGVHYQLFNKLYIFASSDQTS